MRTLHVIIGVDETLNKVTLLRELLYPADNLDDKNDETNLK